jgi:hypothetical protein
MAPDPESDAEFNKLADLVKSSFPDLKCLRCGNERFFLVTEPEKIRTLADLGNARSEASTATLACTRCGFLENHLAEPLRRSGKPIQRD